VIAADLAKLVKGAKLRADGAWWDGHCPAHHDRRASLAFADGDRGVIVKCHASCSLAAIAGALGLDVSQLFFANGNGHRMKAPRIVSTYDYHDERGDLLYQVCRLEPKDFRMRKPEGGDWTWSLNGTRRVVYRLNELAEAERVYHVEGEKDADRLVSLGLRATTTPGGASNFRDEYADQLKATGIAEVIVLPDRDEAGDRYAVDVARTCLARGLRVKVVALPGLTWKAKSGPDVSDWLDAGHGRTELEGAVESTPWLDAEPGRPAGGLDYLEPIGQFIAEDDPPQPYIIPELLPAGVVALLHGSPRARKTLGAFELALCAATGTPAFGLKRFTPERRVGVLWIQEEDPRNQTRPRVRRLVQERCGSMPPDTLQVSVRRGVNLDDPLWVARIIEDAKRHHAKLIVFDAARRLSALTDEGPAKVRQLTAVFRSIVTEAGVAVIVVHHDVKDPQTGQDLRRRGQRASGGDWFAASECPIHVERVGDGETLVYPQDYKFSQDPAPFTFSCEYDGLLIKALVGRDTTTAHAETAGVRGKLLAWIQANPNCSKTAMKAAGFGWDTISASLDSLQRDGLVDEAPGRKKGSKLYFAVNAQPSPKAEDSSAGTQTAQPAPACAPRFRWAQRRSAPASRLPARPRAARSGFRPR